MGVRDGTSSLGNFNPLTQYQQTVHAKRLVGGYLSRVTSEQKQSLLRYPVLNALLTLSEPSPSSALTDQQWQRARQSCERFLQSSRLAYVVTDDAQTSPALRRFAEQLLDLEKIMVSDGYTMYRPRVDLAAQAR
jgi:hypothetical protein